MQNTMKQEKGKTAFLGLRVREVLFNRYIRAAARAETSLSALVRFVLENADLSAKALKVVENPGWRGECPGRIGRVRPGLHEGISDGA